MNGTSYEGASYLYGDQHPSPTQADYQPKGTALVQAIKELTQELATWRPMVEKLMEMHTKSAVDKYKGRE